MEKIWQRIETWLEAHAPEARIGLRPGAAEADIASAEKKLDQTLPEAVRQSYLIHDGQDELAFALVDPWQLFSLKSIIRNWQEMQELAEAGTFEGTEVESSGPVRAQWWNPAWIPFAGNGAGDYLCVDLDPKKTQRSGQVITFWHADNKREVISPGFKKWLKRFSEDLEAGRFVVEEDELLRRPPSQ